MTRAQRLKAIRELYAELPQVKCQGLCPRACGPIGLTKLEREVIEKRAGKRLKTVDNPLTGHSTCNMLSATGRCTVYGDRPLICRLYGVTETAELRCSWGCVPERALTQPEINAIFRRIRELGGSIDVARIQRDMESYLDRGGDP